VEQVEASVLGTVYRNEENGYSVVTVRSGRHELTIVGTDTEATYTGTAQSAAAAVASVPVGTTVEYRLGDTGEWSTELPTATDAGEYTIHARATNPNYDTAETTYNFTINPAAVVVAGNAASKTYGQDDPELSATVTGLVNGESADSIVYVLMREAGENAGTYNVVPSGEAVQGNYAVSYVPGTFTINRAQATVTAVEATKVYGQSDPALVAEVSGLVAGDAAAVIDYRVARDAGENVGSYSIVPDGEAVQGNYDVKYLPATFTITRAQATVTAQNAAKMYGTDDPALAAVVSGLVNGDAESVIAYELSRTAGEDVGEYDITATGEAVQGNYDGR